MHPCVEPLHGMDALQTLQMLILQGAGGEKAPCFADAPMGRLASAVLALQADADAAPSPLDLAVLVRHLLRWSHEAAEMAGSVPELLVPRTAGWPDRAVWALVGVRAEERAANYRVTATPWLPGWLPDVPPNGVDGRAAGAPQRRLLNNLVSADPFLTRDFPDRHTYRSAGQRTAVRASLLTPPGSTLLVGLPTGDGKSLIFQVLAKSGFPLQGERGLIVVVTPTVALALDHQETARELNLAEGPLAYQGGDTSGANEQILAQVENGTQRILFTSPEAICRGPLGRTLHQAAERGYLSALVVDEAHLIETWGKEFRPDFQILAGIRTNLLRANQVTPFRTILLSATITDQTVETVRTLFGTGPNGQESFQLFAASYLRPEIEYWVRGPLPLDVRDQCAQEALYHLPRPAILYVTERADAERWVEICEGMGFRRVGMMTGDTKPEERERIVRAWKAGELDLVVGNAAFGLGIDKADVRTVIHACLPESLDRFYQEVGRGGRDGRASLSLLLPTPKDLETARSMQAKHISVKKGHQRWTAMFDGGSRISEPQSETHLLWVDTPPGGAADRLDMAGRRNTQWNINTLTLMATAGLLEMEAMVNLPIDEAGQVVTEHEGEETKWRTYQRIHLKGGPLLDEAEWAELVEPYRQISYRAQEESVAAILSLLSTKECLSQLFAPLYELPDYQVEVARNCGGCPACRNRGEERRAAPVRESAWPWTPAPISGVGAELLDEQNRVMIFYETADLAVSGRKWDRVLKPITAALKRSGIHNVIIPASAPFSAEMLQQRSEDWPLFAASNLLMTKLPPGPAFVLLPAGTSVVGSLLGARAPHEARLYLAHESLLDPHAAGARLRDRHSGRTISFPQFKRQVEE